MGHRVCPALAASWREGLLYLEEYLQAHPQVRLVVIDTWAKFAPRGQSSQRSQYENDYDALTPLKELADKYHVSILVIHHLRKTCAVDVLDEINGSTGVSGAVDGMLILKRERGQHEASVFVTGRDIEQEQQLALTFDPVTALWTLVGNAEDYRRTKERQEILLLLAEQGPDGMTPRQVAEALDKNYHTIRSLLRKMAEAGDIRQRNHQYVVLSEATSCQQHRPAVASDKQVESADPSKEEAPSYLDGTAEDGSVVAPSAGHDPADGGRATPVRQDASERHPLQESNDIQQRQKQDVGNDITITRCHQGYEGGVSLTESRDQSQEASLASVGRASTTEEAPAALLSRNRCPRHPHAHWVRFDPSDQAWCDKLDCWDGYRLMKIGEALEYRCLTDVGGQVMIAQGMDAWSTFVITERVFLVVVATERARELCKTLDIEVPDLSEEAQHLVEVDPRPP